MTVEARVLIKNIPIIKKVAKDVSIDMITAEQEGDCIVCHFIIHDYGDLISIGYMAGIESYFTSVASPLKELMDDIETKIEKVKKGNDV